MQSVKFKCESMRKEYETFALATIRQMRNLVRSKTNTENAIKKFKKDLMEVCNEELDRLYDNKKKLKIAGVGVAGAAVAAPLVAIPPLLGAAVAAAAPTAVLVTSGATAFGAGGGVLGAGMGAVADKLFGERIYVEELNESHDGEESRAVAILRGGLGPLFCPPSFFLNLPFKFIWLT